MVEGSPKDGVQPRDGGVVDLSGQTSLHLISWRISGLFPRPCCCSSVVVPTGAGSVFPNRWLAGATEPAPPFSSVLPAWLLWPASCDSKEPTKSLTAFSSTSEKNISSRGSEAPAISDPRAVLFYYFVLQCACVLLGIVGMAVTSLKQKEWISR